jgi:hypothetical protein
VFAVSKPTKNLSKNLEKNMKRLPKIFLTLTTALMIICLTQTSNFAQTITATLTGEVKDQAGAVVPGAIVTATSVDTGQTKTATTGDNGNYTIPFLPPGTYNVTVERSGFANVVRENIRLEIAQTATVDIDLGVTAGTVNVNVDSNETPILQTETSNLETTIEQKLIEDLPTADRNIFNFVNLVPGTIDAGAALGNAGSAVGSAGNRNFFDSNFAVSGGRASSNDILLDGVTNTIGDFGGVAISPPQDSIREFKVISGVAPAEYGRTAGGIVTIVSKSGGNKFHGALYEYFQDRELNANGFFRNRNPATARRINVNRSQFGGAISGPVFLPAFNEGGPILYNGKNRTFFFFNYEARREDNPFSTFSLITVPTAAQRTGNLTDLLGGNRTDILFGANNPGGAAGTPVRFGQIFNPYGALVNYISINPTTGAQTVVQGRPIFANNDLSSLPTCTSAVRTSACLDPVARAVLGYIPLPNSTGSTLPNTPGVINNFAINETTKFTRDIFAGRIDQRISDKQSFFGRFSYEIRRDAQPNYFNSEASNARTIRDTFGNFTLNHVYSFTPTVINNIRYGYTRVRANQIPNGNGFDATTLGLPSYLREGAANLQFPDFTIGGGADALTVPGQLPTSSIGGAGNNQPRDVHTVADAVTIVRGSHTIKTGGEFRLYRFYPFQYFTPQGSFSFDRTFTRGPVAATSYTNAATAGSALASFLLGLPSSGNREAVTALTIYKKYGAGFVQDDWKVRPNLTLNLGVRYELETGTGETNQLVTNFDVNAPSPINGQTRVVTDAFVNQLNPSVSNIRGLLSYPEGAQTEANKKQFAPRVGFAYGINEKTTLRGGYGLFYLPQSLEGTSAAGTNFTTNLTQSVQTAQIGASTVTLLNPFPNGIQGVTGNTLGGLTQLGGGIQAVAPKRPTSYNQQWNLVIQRQLAKNLVLDVAYVGSRGVRLPVQSVNLNQLSPQTLAFARDNFAAPGTCPTTAAPNTACTSATQFLSFQVANPFQGLIPAVAGLNGAMIARAQLLRPFPQYQTVTDFRPLIGESKYHALQINLQKRFSDGLSGTASYVWSKLMDTSGVGNGAAFLDPSAIQDIYDYRREYSLSTLDVPHRFVGSFSYELPFGRNRRFGKNFGTLANALFGGYKLSGTATWQKGTPILIIANGFSELTGFFASQNAVRRPNRVGENTFSISDFRENARNGTAVIDINAFATPAALTLGDGARTYDDVRRDNFRNFDLSLAKIFGFNENRQKLEFRVEALNVLNLVVFGTPGNNINAANFGIVTTQGNRPRIVQLVGRFTF